jgi:hypothetical protein
MGRGAESGDSDLQVILNPTTRRSRQTCVYQAGLSEIVSSQSGRKLASSGPSLSRMNRQKCARAMTLMSQGSIDIANSSLVRFQIQNHDLPETIWHTSVLNQFWCRHPPSPAVAGQSLASVSEKTRQASRVHHRPRLSPSTIELTATLDRHHLYGGGCRIHVRVESAVHSKPPTDGCELKSM